MECIPLEQRHLEDPVRLELPGVDFNDALDAAKTRASKIAPEPMLLAWYDGTRGVFSPKVICCDEDRPSWLVYAESRGADITISINGLEYVFLFKRG